MRLSFAGIPRDWFGGNVLATHRANALDLLFPAGESFFVASVVHYLPRITDSRLRARVRGFLGQESSHRHAHERALGMLEAQGYEIRAWLRSYERTAVKVLQGWLPPSVRLSVTVALEHLTAAMAEVALTGRLLDHVHPGMQRLLLWHAAEEIEHRSVAFDVLAAVAPGYLLRVLGLVLGGLMLWGWWRSATRMLLRQEVGYDRARRRRERAELSRLRRDRRALLRAVEAYLRPGFHPDERDDGEVGRRYLEEIGRLEG